MALIYAHYLLGIMLLLNVVFLLLFSGIDSSKKRKPRMKEPMFSVMMGVFNEEAFISKSIKSVYDTFKGRKFEFIVIDDASTDGTLKKLKALQKKYGFTLVVNAQNKGRVRSVNEAFDKTRGDVVLILDSDLLFNKTALDDMIKRFRANPNVGGVSCRYQALNPGKFLSTMQSFEYTFIALWHKATSMYSAVGMFGGCMAVRRAALKEVDLFSVNAITDDTDMAMKLTRGGWKVEQSLKPVYTIVPTHLRGFIRQKIRWGSGFSQAFTRYPLCFLKNHVFILFVFVFIFFMLLINNSTVSEFFGTNLLETYFSLAIQKNTVASIFFGLFIYPIFSVPYIYLSGELRVSKLWRAILVYPFSIVYLPLIGVIYAPSFIRGFYKALTLDKDTAAWVADRQTAVHMPSAK